MAPSTDTLNALSFIGQTLSPFFLEDPRTGSASDLFEALSTLDAEEAAQEWPLADSVQARTALQLMVEGLASSQSAEADGHFRADDELTFEYRRLFVGPSPMPAPPWGSVYTDRDQVIFGETTLRLRSWMRSHSVSRLANDRMPDDHIGLMLSLAASLATERPDLVSEFLESYLLPWAPHYLQKLRESAEHPFYQGLALLTELSLDGAQANLSLTVTIPRFYR